MFNIGNHVDFYRNDGLVTFGNKSFQINGVIYYEQDEKKKGVVNIDKGHYFCESIRPYHLKPKAVDAHEEWYRFDDTDVTRIGPRLDTDETMSMDERFLNCVILLYKLAPEETTISQLSSFVNE